MQNTKIEANFGKDKLRVEPWGDGAVRIRHTRLKDFRPFDWSLSDPVSVEGSIEHSDTLTHLVTADMNVSLDTKGDLSFSRRNEEPFLSERRSPRAFHEGGRILKSRGGNYFRADVSFRAWDDERFWGLGQHQYNAFDQKGLVIPINQKNSQVTIPFIISSRGYGLFWNNPGVGQVEFARNRTRWTAECTEQIDYFVISGPDPAAILNRYYALTGYPTPLPDWATGFWQCKLRYESQEELLRVAGEYRDRKLPLSVIVIDYFHWEKQGMWDFDPEYWPNPEAMVRELKAMGVETMVSVWPTVNPDSPYFEEMDRRGFLIETEKGTNASILFTDTHEKGKKYQHYYDATNRSAGDFVWSKVKTGYVDRGIRIFWLDACEPETVPYDYENLRYAEGNGAAVACLYPMLHEKTFYENMKAAGISRPLNLCRSAWAGSQKYGTAVWSGDIDSSFQSLETQIKAGLNMVSSGIPWWTTDIGGFYGGDTADPSFRELVIRWFQFGLFCPIFRLHGFRNSWDPKKGGDNEVWSFGDEAYVYICDYLKLREALRPYIHREAERACRGGLPLMRPLIFDYFHDAQSVSMDDEYLFGSEILVAPIYQEGQRERTVYLPKGTEWINAWSGETLPGGTEIRAAAPLEKIPVFLTVDSDLFPVFSPYGGLK